ncbi:MAG: branched-chain amino acid ABC transporter substrate-binding protein [Candidatus Limnocylindrales bacterium]
MMRKTIGVAAATGLLATAVAAPTLAQDSRVITIPEGEPITLGVYQVLSGANAVLGEDMVYGIEVAVDERGGELLGHEIELNIQDELCTVEGGAQAALALTSDPTVVGIIGSSCSDATVGGIQTITESGLTAISGSATRNIFTAEDRGPEFDGFLRTAFPDAFQGELVANFIYNELGLTRAATIHDGSAYAEGLVNDFTGFFEELGGEITVAEAVSDGQTDMNPVLTNVAASEPEIIYFPIFTDEGGFIADQVGDVAGLEDVALMGSDGLFSLDFVDAAGPNVEGMYISSPPQDLGDIYDSMVERYLEISGLDSTLQAFHGHTYDATNILLNALEQVAVENDDGSLAIDLGELRSAVYATTDYEGATGTLSCDEFGDCSSPNIVVYQIGTEQIEDGVWPPAVVWNPAE